MCCWMLAVFICSVDLHEDAIDDHIQTCVHQLMCSHRCVLTVPSLLLSHLNQYTYKGSIVTGKLHKKSPESTDANPIWIVTPSDRRRRNEDIPEKMLGKVITAQEAAMNRGPKLKPNGKVRRGTSPTPSNSNSISDGSRSGRGSPSEENSKTSGSSSNNGKRKSDDSNGGGSDSNRANKVQKSVSFSQKSNTSGGNNSSSNNNDKKKKISTTNTKKKSKPSARVGTRSTRGSGEMVLLPELPIKKKKQFKVKRIKKDDNVTVVKMLTGCLYLYRGDRPRAEFVRSK